MLSTSLQVGPMSCAIDEEKIKCSQPPESIPDVQDLESFNDMLETCYTMATSDDETLNEEACNSFTANVFKKNFRKPSSFQETKPCNWVEPRKKKGVRRLGTCAINTKELTKMDFGVYYDS